MGGYKGKDPNDVLLYNALLCKKLRCASGGGGGGGGGGCTFTKPARVGGGGQNISVNLTNSTYLGF